MAIKLDPLQRKKFRADGRVKLHPEQLKQLGFSGTSKRYWTGAGRTISESKARTLREGITKAKRTAALKSGAAQYRTPQSKAAAAYNARTADLSRSIHGLAPRDKRILDAWRRKGFGAFDAEDKERFMQIFDVYPAVEVREALGSPDFKRMAA